jgi:hypothetical protein
MPLERLTRGGPAHAESDEVWPQETGALAVPDGSSLLDLGGRFRIDTVREAIEGRLHVVTRSATP